MADHTRIVHLITYIVHRTWYTVHKINYYELFWQHFQGADIW